MVHVTANFIQPGMIRTRQVLEMNNAGPIPLAIRPGIRICQIILEECVGRARYAGRFQGQEHP
jgi:dCTP deaminase